MIFQSIRIKEGFAERTFDFTDGVNLIFSKENSKGKTTLLRFMLYSLGVQHTQHQKNQILPL